MQYAGPLAARIPTHDIRAEHRGRPASVLSKEQSTQGAQTTQGNRQRPYNINMLMLVPLLVAAVGVVQSQPQTRGYGHNSGGHSGGGGGGAAVIGIIAGGGGGFNTGGGSGGFNSGGGYSGNSGGGFGGGHSGGGFSSGGLIGGGHSGGISSGGYGNSGGSSSCEYWCKSPTNQYYCCQQPGQGSSGGGNIGGGGSIGGGHGGGIIGGGIIGGGHGGGIISGGHGGNVIGGGGGGGYGGSAIHPGQCPAIRPSCPPTRFGPPQTCSSDVSCGWSDKCCFDTCLQRHVCKPAQTGNHGW